MSYRLYNSRQYMTPGKRLLLLMAVAIASGACPVAQAAMDASQPAAELAKKIAAISGPGLAKVIVNNRSSLTAEEVVEIRKLLERDLRGLGVISQARVGLGTGSDSEGATTIRITLSVNAAGGLWVAEVQEGTDVHVAMLPVELAVPAPPRADSGITLGKVPLWRQKQAVLDLLIGPSGANRRMIVLEPERIVSYVAPMTGDDSNSWKKEQEFAVPHERPFPRDIRGRLFAGATVGSAHFFEAYLPGVQCQGDMQDSRLAIACGDSDNPWPMPGFTVVGSNVEPDAPPNRRNVEQRAFFNSSRNYFSGVLSPGLSFRLPAFYDAAAIVRTTGAAMVLSATGGQVVMIENGALKRLAGTRDWGSDLAAIRSGCGSGTQVLVSASGAVSDDSVRAYEISGRDATPVSSPLEMSGAVTAIWPFDDLHDATVVVRRSEIVPAVSAAGQQGDYEVYRVSAHCN
jgi:hypothetical protein